MTTVTPMANGATMSKGDAITELSDYVKPKMCIRDRSMTVADKNSVILSEGEP